MSLMEELEQASVLAVQERTARATSYSSAFHVSGHRARPALRPPHCLVPLMENKSSQGPVLAAQERGAKREGNKLLDGFKDAADELGDGIKNAGDRLTGRTVILQP